MTFQMAPRHLNMDQKCHAHWVEAQNYVKMMQKYHSNVSDTCRDVKGVRNNPVVLENMSEIIRRTQNAW